VIPVLETERLTLRAPTPADFDAYAAFRATERARFVGGVLERADAWRTYAFGLGHWHLRGYGMWAVEERATGTWLGHVGLWFPEGWIAREVGWMLAEPAFEGRGFAREAAEAARRHAYRVLGWQEVFSVIHPENARSLALARRLGAALGREVVHDGARLLVFRHPGPEEAP
jgi:RimJ/RimL family protein N-acetyltransferase